MVFVERPEDVGDEVDIAVSLATHAWFLRTGGVGSHDKGVRPVNIKVMVGNNQVFVSGPQLGEEDLQGLPGGRRTTQSRKLPKTPLVAGGLAAIAAATAPPIRPPLTPRRHPYVPRAGTRGEPEEFVVPDFILMESPMLAEMLWSQGGGEEVGPVRRNAALFAAVLNLLKLRWMIRLDAAVRELCQEGPTAQTAGFHHLLENAADVIVGLEDNQHSPVQAYELVLEALKATLGGTHWPLFLAYVGTHDRGISRPNAGGMPSHMSHPSWAMSMSTMEHVSQACWKAVDDTFIAWLAQQDSQTLPAKDVMEEFQYYGVASPQVKLSFHGLMAWCGAPFNTKHQFLREARLEVAHLAVLLEIPSLRDSWQHSKEDMLYMVKEVCNNPRTFSPRIRTRIVRSLLNGPITGINVLSLELTEEQLKAVWSSTAGPSDAGLLDNGMLEALRDKRPPWLVGGSVVDSRYKKAPPPLVVNDIYTPRMPPPKSPATVRSLLGPSATTSWKT